MFYRLIIPVSLVVSGVIVAVGCGGEDGGGGAQSSTIDPKTNIEVFENGFESDDPSGRPVATGSSSDAGAAAASSSSSSGATGAPSKGSNDEASRTVLEADIVKLDGNRLYALSQYGGLAVVDVSDPAHMKLLGRKRLEGVPFEMYVQDGRAYVTLNSFGRWVEDGGYGQWVQTSELMTLDVSNPTTISELGHFDVPGEISDSRLVGDALYLVTFESGYCWNCGKTPATIVTSFGVKSGVTKVDQIEFRAPTNTYSFWRRSVSATNQRLYIGGPSWSWDGYSDANRQSVVQVVDISDPSGHLKRGADVAIAGQINSRWQMDEFEGHLRVVSQFGNGWFWNGSGVNPVVQTFKINSSASITAAGQTELTMPEPETLQSVRFDGTRGYAITARQTDPLFTIDLSTPTAPKQVGTLEMPGSIFHMEPRGDRLVGFGNDNGTLAVSLFDVTDMAKPTMLSRVNVGSGWGSIGEDADRIHKAVRVLDQDGTILLPFASYGGWDGSKCETPQSGIQIIDYAKSGLKLRGLAPHYGQPRRAMLLPNHHLLGMSDRSVSTFDIAARDNPTKKGELDLSNPAYRMVETPSHIASMTNDWWSGEPMLSLTPKANADDANPTGKVSLSELTDKNASTCGYWYGSGAYTAWYDARLFADGSTVFLTVPVYSNNYSGDSKGRVVVAAIDTSNPSVPRIVGRTEIPLSRASNGYWAYGGCGVGLDGYAYYSYFGGYNNLVGAGDSFVHANGKLAYLEVVTDLVDEKGNVWDNQNPIYDWSKFHTRYSRILHTVNLSNPQNLVAEAAINLPDSLGTTPLHVMNGTVLTSRWVASPTTPGKVRFYIDRVDLTGVTKALSSVNVPGSLLHVDAPSSRLVTTDYHVSRLQAADYQECYERTGRRGQFDYDLKTCTLVDRDFKLADIAGTKVTLRQTFVPPSQNIGGVQLTDDRIYMTHYSVYDYSYGGTYDPYNPPKPRLLEEGGLWAIGGLRDGNLAIKSQLSADAQWPLAAQGNRVAVYQSNGLAIYDSSAPVPALVSSATLRGYGYSSYVLLSPDHAVASLGEWGLQTIRW
ncbi:MAG: beta-propeller domain-containing protein [Labilithrix sp.]